MPVGFVAVFCSDWQPTTQQGISPSWKTLFLETPFQNPPERSALVVLCCWWGRGLGSLLLSRTSHRPPGPGCFPGGRAAWAAPPQVLALEGRVGHSCSSLKPCTSLEGVWYLPLPLRPTSGAEDWGLTTTLQRTIGKLQTQRVFSLLPEQGQYGLILESRKVSSKLSESKGGETHSLKLGFLLGKHWQTLTESTRFSRGWQSCCHLAY